MNMKKKMMMRMNPTIIIKPSVKKLSMLSKWQQMLAQYSDQDDDEEEEDLEPEAQNEKFTCDVPKPEECDFLKDEEFDKKTATRNINCMNYLSRKSINYPTCDDEALSEDAMKILEKVEPNKKKGEKLCTIFNRVWYDVMNQHMKFLNEEDMNQIIASYIFHTLMRTLRDSNLYKEKSFKLRKTENAGMEAVRSWLKWTSKLIPTEKFYENLKRLEDAMKEEKVIETKIYEIFEAVMIIQELLEDPVTEFQRMAQEIDETNEIEGNLQENEGEGKTLRKLSKSKWNQLKKKWIKKEKS
jgi:hypothetical protein